LNKFFYFRDESRPKKSPPSQSFKQSQNFKEFKKNKKQLTSTLWFFKNLKKRFLLGVK